MGGGGNCLDDELPHCQNARKCFPYVRHTMIHEHGEFQHLHICVNTAEYQANASALRC